MIKNTLLLLVTLASTAAFSFEGELQGTGNLGYENALVELEPKSFKGGQLVFTMYVNTHSVNFEFFDLQASTELTVNGRVFKPIEVPGLYGHHNEGELVFSIGEEVKTDVKVTITDMAGEEFREYVWPLE